MGEFALVSDCCERFAADVLPAFAWTAHGLVMLAASRSASSSRAATASARTNVRHAACSLLP